MKRSKITHRTAYFYKTPVIFGAHRALVRPREGHDVHIESALFEVTPTPNVRWIRDIYGNSIALMTFAQPSQELSVSSEIVVSRYVENPLHFLIARDPEKASPLSGVWEDPAEAFDRLQVIVQVVEM